MSDLNSLYPSEVERLGLIMAKVIKARDNGFVLLHSDAVVIDLQVEGIDPDEVELLRDLGVTLCRYCE